MTEQVAKSKDLRRQTKECMDDLTVLEVVPRNSPSLLNVVVNYIHAFAVNNNMRLNLRKCKTVTVDFLHYNSCVLCPN